MDEARQSKIEKQIDIIAGAVVRIEGHVEKIERHVESIANNMATKNDLVSLKDDLVPLETKIEAGFEKISRDQDNFRDRQRLLETRVDKHETTPR